MKPSIIVYHTTSTVNAFKIVRRGYRVAKSTEACYGRGIYFWELKDDAHRYGVYQQLGGKLPEVYVDRKGNVFEGYSVLPHRLTITVENSLTYPFVETVSPDTATLLTSILLQHGKRVMIIPNRYIQRTAHQNAKGRAYVYLLNPGLN